jgi:acyl carrier protein|tara:strand:+ start:490 stop:996 length:507 start_codon:yes stop_codon:yes gene_type:complete
MTKKEKKLLHELIAEQVKARGSEVDPDSITAETDFIKDLGLDSLDLVEIVIGLETKMGTTFDFDINDFMIVEDMGDVYAFVDQFKEKLKKKLAEEARVLKMTSEERLEYEIGKLRNMVNMLPEGEAKEEKEKELELGVRLIKEKGCSPNYVFGLSLEEMEAALEVKDA